MQLNRFRHAARTGRRALAPLLACWLLASGLQSAGAQSVVPYTVDVIASLTGPAAFAGKAEKDALTLYEAIANRHGGINGQPIHFALHDDQSRPEVAVQLAAAIAATHPAVVLGCTLAQSCGAIAPLFVKGPVLLAFSPVFEPAPGGYVFTPNYKGEDGVAAQLRYFLGKGISRIAILSTTDASGQGGDRATRAALQLPEFRSVRVVSQEHFNPSDVSVVAQVARVKAAGPQALMVWASGTPFGTVLHSLADGGIDLPLATYASNMVAEQLADYLHVLPRDLFFCGQSWLNGNRPSGDPLKGSVAEFIAAFKGAGLKPTAVAATAWDPARIVVASLRRLGQGATASQVRSYIEGLHDFPGAAGMFDFRRGDQHGLDQRAVLVVRWDAGEANYILVSRQGGAPLNAAQPSAIQ